LKSSRIAFRSFEFKLPKKQKTMLKHWTTSSNFSPNLHSSTGTFPSHLLRLTTHHRYAQPAEPKVLLALVVDSTEVLPSPILGEAVAGETQDKCNYEEKFGDRIIKKKSDVLRIAFQNIGGFPLFKNKLKDDALRCGISTYEFDVFGIAKTNTDWRIQSDDLKLYGRTTGWWETLNINFTHNRTQKPITKHQWGGNSNIKSTSCSS
jgi:hypothetical protein